MNWRQSIGLRSFVFSSVLLLVCSAGCTSIQGYRVWTDGQGRAVKQDIGGLPITVKTPTKAVFVVTTRTYRLTQPIVEGDVVTGQRDLGRAAEVTISEEPFLLGPTEVYAIDLKRPANGTIDFTVELADQYPTRVTGKVEDKTLEQVRQVVENLVAKLLPAPVVPQAGEMVERTLLEQTLKLVVFDLQTGGVEVLDLK